MGMLRKIRRAVIMQETVGLIGMMGNAGRNAIVSDSRSRNRQVMAQTILDNGKAIKEAVCTIIMIPLKLSLVVKGFTRFWTNTTSRSRSRTEIVKQVTYLGLTS